MLKKKLLAFAVPALMFSFVFFTTSCDKEETDDDVGGGDTFEVADFIGTYFGQHIISMFNIDPGIDPIADTLIVEDGGGSNAINITSTGLGLTFTGTINTDNGTVKLDAFEADSVNIVSTVDSMIYVKNVKATGVTSNSKLNADKTTVTTQLKVVGKAYGLNTVSDALPEEFNIPASLDARLTGSFTKQ